MLEVLGLRQGCVPPLSLLKAPGHPTDAHPSLPTSQRDQARNIRPEAQLREAGPSPTPQPYWAQTPLLQELTGNAPENHGLPCRPPEELPVSLGENVRGCILRELRGGRRLPSSPGMFTQVHLRTPLAMVDIQLLQGSTLGSINRVCPPESPLGQGHRPFPAEVLRSPLLSLKPPGVSHSGEADLACHLHPWKKDSPWTWHRTPLTSQHRRGTVGQDRSLNGSRPCSAQVRLDLQPPPCPSSPLLPPHTGRLQSRCQPGGRSTKLPKPCGRVGAGSRGPIRSPLEDPFPDQPFSADSWGPRWQLSPLIPRLQLPGC